MSPGWKSMSRCSAGSAASESMRSSSSRWASRQARHIGMVLRLVDVPTDVHEPEPVGQPRHDRDGEPRPLAGPFLAVEVEVPRLVQATVRDRVVAGPARCRSVTELTICDRPPDFGRLQAQQPDHVRPVDVERLRQPGAIAAHRRIVRVGAVVADMAEQIAVSVLRHRHPEVGTEDHVRDRRALLTELVDRKAPHEHEPSPGVELVGPTVDHRAPTQAAPHRSTAARSASGQCRRTVATASCSSPISE